MKVKLERVKNRMTQEEVCKKAKISRATLVKVERGDFSPLNYNKMISLANVLGCNAKDLFFSKGDAEHE
jgi:DNA-binding XRE family transcriptional regulator